MEKVFIMFAQLCFQWRREFDHKSMDSPWTMSEMDKHMPLESLAHLSWDFL